MICRLCNNDSLYLIRSGISQSDLKDGDYCITDARYGTHLPIYGCPKCGLRQCESPTSLDEFYKNLIDGDYEIGRPQRMKQMVNLLNFVCQSKYMRKQKRIRLLDVGAGSGILLEAAVLSGGGEFSCLGVEPSLWLYEKAQAHGLPVICGTVDDISERMRFDLITCVDIIEHVANPVEILKKCSSLLDKGGRLLIVTPDNASFAARLFGYRWWHYRIAHISYFNIETLKFALAAAGLTIIALARPSWYFTLEYLCKRLTNYLPEAILPRGRWLSKIAIPVNIFDSIAVIASKF